LQNLLTAKKEELFKIEVEEKRLSDLKISIEKKIELMQKSHSEIMR
jgi:hypothetical protein